MENTAPSLCKEVNIIEKTLTYSDYLAFVEEEEERIEGIENDIQVKTLELNDVQNSIKEKERERLEEIKTTYEALVARRKQGQEELQQLKEELEDKRSYLYSLYQDEEYEVSNVDFYVNDVLATSSTIGEASTNAQVLENNKIKCTYNFKKTYF